SEIQRGKQLADAGDCTGCHSGPKGLYAGGHPLATPFGTLLGPNLTPDRQSGIGAWTDSEFIDALQKGIGHGGAHLYPGMPYTYYTKMTRADAMAIRAYLNTVPPINNPVHSNQLPFPFNIRTSAA